MLWYVYSILSSLSFVGLYLCIKWLTTKGFAPKQILLFMVGFALIGFFGATVSSLHSVVNSDKFSSFLGAATFAGIFASIGHWADFEAIGRAPNPGYATSIRNTSILPVTILSVIVFDSSFHLIRLVGIFLIIYSINFIFFFVICRKELRSYFEDKIRLKFFLPVVFICAFFAFTVNLLNIKAISLAPNPGYHEAIRNTNVLFITLLAIPLFSASINKQKMIGIVSTVAGIVVLVI